MSRELSAADWRTLRGVLREAQHLGFLGPGAVDEQIERSVAFSRAVEDVPGHAVDLGSGGGLPGLVLADRWPAAKWLLLDANRRRTAFLDLAVKHLGLTGSVTVRCQRAEEAGRDPTLRAMADLVVARSFGPPAVTAECGAPFLRVGGHLVVAEPPGGAPDRWPAQPLAQLGLQADASLIEPTALQRLIQLTLCPDRFPRRTGIPAKRPLFSAP